jgi:phage recombination protein Bet
MKTDLTITNDQVNDQVLIEYLDVMGISPKLDDKEKIQFLNIAKTFGLNPFKREIFCTVYGEGQYKQLSIITGYEVYIKRAERSGKLDGWNATTSGSVATNDLKAVVTIYRKDRQHPFVWEVFYDECVQKKKDGTPTAFWQKANFMTKKVCISQAFRLCFSDELGGMPYTQDEMPQKTDVETIDVAHEVVTAVFDYTDTLKGAADDTELANIYKSIPKEQQPQYVELCKKIKSNFANIKK